MPPVNTIVVQTVLLPPDRRREALSQAKTFNSSWSSLIKNLRGDYLIGKFTADIMSDTPLYEQQTRLRRRMSNLKRYVDTISSRPAFDIAINMQ